MTRKFVVHQPGPKSFIVGLGADDESVDVTTFGKSDPLLCTTTEGPKSDFYLAEATWKQLGKPTEIIVTVQAA